MADQANPAIGSAAVVYGEVKAQSADGVERIIKPGSPVFLNDRINTGSEGAVSIVFTDSADTQLDLGRMTDMMIDQSVLGAEEIDIDEVTAEIEAIQQALEGGQEIDVAATAAGGGGAGTGGGGRVVYEDSLDGKIGSVTSGADTDGVLPGFTSTLLRTVLEEEGPAVQTFAETAETIETIDDETEEDNPFTPPEIGDGAGVVDESQLPWGTNAVINPDVTLVEGMLDVEFGDAPQLVTFRSVESGNTITWSPGQTVTVSGVHGILTINPDGSWVYDVDDNIYHPNPGLIGEDDSLPDDFTMTVNYVDENGNPQSVTGNLDFEILDDGPIVTGNQIGRVAEEEALDSASSGDVLSDGNQDDIDAPDDTTPDTPEDASQPDSSVISGNLNPIVNMGADSPGTWSLVSTQGLPALLSQGVEVEYRIVGNTLEAWAGGTEEGRLVFTFTVQSNGNYTFELLDQLDHTLPEGVLADENVELQVAEEGSPVSALNLGQTVQATDSDGDSTQFGADAVQISLVDDIPIMVGDPNSHDVEEEALHNYDPEDNAPADGNIGSEGNEDDSGAWEFGDPGTTVASGSLAGMVSVGADEGLTYGFVENYADVLETANGVLTSQGETITYSVSGNVLTAEAGGRDVFTLEVNETTGDYDFALLDQLDHEAPSEGVLAEENNMPLNLGVALQAEDFDGDAVVFDSVMVEGEQQDALTVNVADDIPVATEVRESSIAQSMNLILILDQSGSMGYGPDYRIADLNEAIDDLFDGIANDQYLTGAEDVRVHVVSYSGTGTTVGTYDVKVDSQAGVTSLADLTAGGVTNYEDGMHEALQWIYEDWPNDLSADPNDGTDELPPLTGSDVVNKVLFVSDGIPNTKNNGIDDASGTSSGSAVAHYLGTAGADGVSELDALKDWGSVEAIGIDIDTLANQSAAEAILNQISSDGSYTLVNSGSDLGPTLGSLLPINQSQPLIDAYVMEDGLDTVDGDTNDASEGIREAGEDTADDEAGSAISDAQGNDLPTLAELFQPGADEPLKFSLSQDTSDLPILFSNGVQLVYDVNEAGDTLVAYRDGESVGEPVFSLTVVDEDTGEWAFDLDDQIDHVDNGLNDENTELVSDNNSSVDGIDLSSVITATDYDNDQVVGAADGAFVISIQDDVPEAVNDVGYAFGFSSYADTDTAPPPVFFDVLANDESGADELLTLVDAQVVSGGGEATVEGGQVKFDPAGDSFSEEAVIEYTIADADGDTSTATLTVIENLLIVGQNVDDNDDSQDLYVVGEGADGNDFGTIDGGAGNDILIGDYGGVSSIDGKLEIMFILDVSGSMGGDNLTGLKTAMTSAFDSLATDPNASEVRVHIVQFSNNASLIGTGTYDISTPADLALATTAIDGLSATGFTNYEAGIKLGLTQATDNPLDGADRQAFFISDGQPNRAIDDADSTIEYYSNNNSGFALAFDEVNGGDGSDEIAQLEAWAPGQVEAIFITEDADAVDLTRMNEIASGEAFTSAPVDIGDIILDASGSVNLANVGDDTIEGGEGDDLIYGDAVFTDSVWADLGVDAPVDWAEGDGWAVFESLESGSVTGFDDWSRTDTINYILEHQAELAQETTTVEDPDGREGGDDSIMAEGGDDVVFGQEGTDSIGGGSGADVLVGGTGSDGLGGDPGNDLLVGDAIEIIPDGADTDTDPDGVDIVEDGAVDTLGGGTGTDIAVDNDPAEDDSADDVVWANVEDSVDEGVNIDGEDPLLILIDDTTII